MKWTLLASAPNLASIMDCVDRFYGGERKQIVALPCGGDGYGLFKADGQQIAGVRIVAKGKRYRFESAPL